MDLPLLNGHHINLELLCEKHQEDLCAVVSSAKLWKHDLTFIPTPELIPTYILLSRQAHAKGEELPFAIIDKGSYQAVGSIKLQRIDKLHAEIGSTFIDPKHQKSSINKEAKFLLMQYAFESLHLHYIDFIIHKKNKISQRSVEKIGIKKKSSFSHLKNMPQWETHEYFSYRATSKEWVDIKEELQDTLFPPKI